MRHVRGVKMPSSSMFGLFQVIAFGGKLIKNNERPGGALLGGSWVLTSRETMVATLLGVLITRLRSTHEPPRQI